MRKNLIRMDVHIYSVKAENQAVNIWVYVMTTHKEQGCKMLSLGPQIFTGNLAGGLGFRREHCGGYVSISVNTPRKANFEINLPCKSCCNFTSWFKEGRSWSILIRSLKSVFTSSPDVYWRKRPNRRPIWNYATVTLTLWKWYLTRSCNPTQLRGSAHICKL